MGEGLHFHAVQQLPQRDQLFFGQSDAFAETSEVFADSLAPPVYRSEQLSGRACWTMKTSEVLLASTPIF